MLLAAVFEIRRGTHALERILVVALRLCHPGLRTEDLDLDLTRPVTLVRLLELSAKADHCLDVRERRRRITAARRAHGAGEMRDGLRCRIAGTDRLELSCTS